MIIIYLLLLGGAGIFGYQSYKSGWQKTAYNVFAAILVIAAIVVATVQIMEK